MEPTEIIITNLLPTGTGFAVLADDMTQNVFVPSKNIADMGLKPGDRISAIIVPNATHGHKTPWLAISIVDAKDKPAVDLESLILADLDEGRATAPEISESIGQPYEAVAATLGAMAKSGKLLCYTVFDLPEDE